MENNKPTYEFQKNAGEKVIIQPTTFKGHQLIDVRVFFNANAGGAKEEWKPSPKGLSIRTDQLSELKKGIDKTLKELEKK